MEGSKWNTTEQLLAFHFISVLFHHELIYVSYLMEKDDVCFFFFTLTAAFLLM